MSSKKDMRRPDFGEHESLHICLYNRCADTEVVVPFVAPQKEKSDAAGDISSKLFILAICHPLSYMKSRLHDYHSPHDRSMSIYSCYCPLYYLRSYRCSHETSE